MPPKENAMNKHFYENTTGTEGLFTFNFFCEALIGSMQTMSHLMEHEKIEPPYQLAELQEELANIGIGLMEDYQKKVLDMDRVKGQMISITTMAYDVEENLVPLLRKSSDQIRYYYYVFVQGTKLLYPCLMEKLVEDLPEGADISDLVDKKD
jgi:hypothetical protein